MLSSCSGEVSHDKRVTIGRRAILIKYGSSQYLQRVRKPSRAARVSGRVV